MSKICIRGKHHTKDTEIVPNTYNLTARDIGGHG
jgi:hypothetical protein